MSLKTRTLTGIVFGAVMIGGTLAHSYSCAALFLAVGLACLWEYSNLVLAKDSPEPFHSIRKFFALFVGIFPALLLANTELGIFPLLSDYAFWFFPIVFAAFIFELFAQSAKPFDNIGFILLGLVYIGVPIALVEAFCLRESVGNQLVMAMLAIVWVSDSFAYLAGSKIGRTPFFPRISPKKTWEGTLSGLAGALGMGALCSVLFPNLAYTMPQWLVIALVASSFGILGDLVESMLKRSLGIKDSGTILPGHGGFLDRFDAFLFLVPFVAFTIIFLFKDTRFVVWFM